MAQLQVQGSTAQSRDVGEGKAGIVASLEQWLQENNLSDVAAHIVSQFKQLNCHLEELLEFSKQDLIDFAKDDLQLKSPLKRNRFVNGVLRLQTQRQENKHASGSRNTIILSEKENDILIDLDNKLYVLHLYTKYCLFNLYHSP